MKTYNFRITIEQDEDGIFVARCPSLPGCHTQAKTYETVVERMEEAVELYLEVLKERKQDDIIFQIPASWRRYRERIVNGYFKRS